MSILYSICISLLYCKHWEIHLFSRKKNFIQIKRQETDKYLLKLFWKNSPKSQSLSFRNLSFSAMTYQIQANQCATKMKKSISIVNITALYCEYLSIFCNRRASLSNLVSFTKWILLWAVSCNKNRKMRNR